jgi:peptidoglycan/xylan/chitin deacetylase (PgdA/CDA1 family)
VLGVQPEIEPETGRTAGSSPGSDERRGARQLGRSRRDRAASLMAKPGLRRVVRRLPKWRGVIVLNYHRVGDSSGQPWDRTLWNADAESFDTQLATLAADADVIGPTEAVALAREKRPGRHVLLTFDDGYRDNYEIAFPLLRRHGLTAAFFPATGFLDNPGPAWWDELAWMVRHASNRRLPAGDALQELALGPECEDTIAALTARYKELPEQDSATFLDEVADATGSGRCPASLCGDLWMTWDMVRELRSGGMEIGGHTVTHPILARLTQERQREEIYRCAERLEAELDCPMRWFAYPVGSLDAFTEGTQQLLGERGVQLAFSFYGGFAGFAHWKPLDIPRVHVGPSHGPELLQAILCLPQLFARW